MKLPSVSTDLAAIATDTPKKTRAPFRWKVRKASDAEPTHVQLRILQAIADGMVPKRIPEALHLRATAHHVAVQVSSLRAKIGASSTAHAIAIAFRKGWVK